MAQNSRTRLSFQFLVAVAFALFILFTGGLIGYLSFRNGQLTLTPVDLLGLRLAGIDQLAELVGLAALAALLICVLAAFRVSQPVWRLNDSAQAVSRGEWRQRVTLSSPEVIAELATAFSAEADQGQTAFEAIQASKQRYQTLFEESPVALWQEDGSALKQHLDELRAQGITSWRKYFEDHPEEVRACAARVKVTDVNRATLKMFEAGTKEAFSASILPAFSEKALGVFQDLLIELVEGSHYYETDSLLQTLTGKPITAHTKLSILPGYEDTWEELLVAIEDITQRTQAEQELRKLSQAVEQSNASIVITDASGRIEYVNPYFSELTGYSVEEATGKNPRILQTALTPRDTYPELWETILAGKEWRGEFCNQKKNGERYWESASISPVFDHSGSITHLIAIKTDITEQKRSRDILQARLRLIEFGLNHSVKELLQATLDEVEKLTGSSIGFYHLLNADEKSLLLQAWSSNTLAAKGSLAGMISYSNIDDAGIWGDCIRERRALVHNDLASQPSREALPVDHPTVTRELAVPVFRGERIVAILGVGNKPQDYLDGDIETCIRLADFSWDIVERKQAEEALRKSEELFSKAFRSSPMIVAITRFRDGMILEVNEALEMLMGYTAEEVIGKTLEDLSVWINGEDKRRLVRILLSERKLRNFEIEFRTKTGSRLHCSYSAELIKLDGEKCVLATIEDISERKKAEAHTLRLNRLYETISQINEAIVRASSREHLFSEICRVSIEYGQFCMAWIGMVDELSDLVHPVAIAGDDLDFLSDVDIHYDHQRRGAGTVGSAIREGRCIICQDIASDPRMAAWREKALNRGLRSVAAVPIRSHGVIIGALAVYASEPHAFDAEDKGLLDQISDDVSFAIDSIEANAKRQQAEAELVEAYDTTLEGWAKALELKDNETVGHSRRVIEKTVALAQAMGFQEEALVHIRRGAILHDIGKMGIPDQILRKNGPLNDAERQIVMKHPQTAYDFLKPISYLQKAIDIPYCHHEKWDGSGYPRGLKGEDIPLSARIFAVVDVWDALSSDRPYRKAWPQAKIERYLLDESGKHFDPQVVQAFLRMIGA